MGIKPAVAGPCRSQNAARSTRNGRRIERTIIFRKSISSGMYGAEEAPEYRPGGGSFFEQNCGQIFTKGPALTKEILGKVNAEIVPKRTRMFGREFRTKPILMTSGICLLLFASLLVAFVTCLTDTIDDYMLSQLALKNGSDAFAWWQKPPAKALYKLHIFNYTNIEDYADGFVDKFDVKELGPYTYEETLERVDLSFPTEDTISFREKRSIRFLPELSKGSETDKLVVPNLPLLSGSAATKSSNYLVRLGFDIVVNGMEENAFVEVAAGAFVTGYQDKLYELAKNFLPPGTPGKMGIMADKSGVSPTRFTINTGAKDIAKLAAVSEVDGASELGYFSSGECNSVEGTDGALHPPTAVRDKRPLHYFFPQACRRMPLVYQRETRVLNGLVPAYRYVHPEDIFDTVEENPRNGCFCDGLCPPKGVFNISACNYNAPMFLSHPHFHRGDPKLIEPFVGLQPNRGDFESYFDLHPTMGFAMRVRNLVQINVQVQKALSVDKVDMFEDGVILPIAWMEGVVDDTRLPDEVRDIIDLVTFTVPIIKLALEYGSLLTAVITTISLGLVLSRYRRRSKGLLRLQQGYSSS
ncbi:unnamed protein product [Phyllotreta striolata]|uniref:Scavenger receptor class B member 1 n=1 Tax=Phyllotreta striolata TaxID=444603 RepID=A0A9P0GW06_PHYSR|nr:unnamed protein product [Phyllotreta striolata]